MRRAARPCGRQALRAARRSAEAERLRQAWREGLASDKPEPFDIEAIKTKARELYAR